MFCLISGTSAYLPIMYRSWDEFILVGLVSAVGHLVFYVSEVVRDGLGACTLKYNGRSIRMNG